MDAYAYIFQPHNLHHVVCIIIALAFITPMNTFPPQGKSVLELGCGHGLPGILCMLAGATVHFQDFNPQVLHELTMPNVSANLALLPPGRPRPSARYFSGDWTMVGTTLSSKGLGGHYDIVLASECIYNLGSQQPLLECIKQVCRSSCVFSCSQADTEYSVR